MVKGTSIGRKEYIMTGSDLNASPSRTGPGPRGVCEEENTNIIISIKIIIR
jgi:hypothetical protein